MSSKAGVTGPGAVELSITEWGGASSKRAPQHRVVLGESEESTGIARSESEMPLRGASGSKSSYKGIAMCAALLIAGVVGAVLIFLFAHSAQNAQFRVPKTFSARFVSHDRMSGNASSVTGYLYKDEMPNGTWIVSGHVTTTTHGSQVTRVTSLHNKVYYEVTRSGSSVPHQQGCLGHNDVPAELPQVGAALQAGAPLGTDDVAAGDLGGCPDPKERWVFVFAGQHYVVCWQGDNEVQLLGPGFVADVVQIDLSPSASTVTVPTNVTSKAPLACPPVLSPVTSTATKRRLAAAFFGDCTGYDYPPGCSTGGEYERRLEEVTLRGARTPPQRPEGGGVPGADRLRQAVWANQQGGSSAVERRLDDGSGDDSGSGPRPDPRADHSSITYQWYGVRPDWEPHMTCVFVHGAGVTNDMAPRTSYKKYWGYMNEHTAVGCASYKFLVRDTTTRSWEDFNLQQYFCTETADGDGIIRDTVVFAHGMGNLIVAGALENSLCKFDLSSSHWIEAQPSYNMAVIAEFGHFACGEIMDAIRRQENDDEGDDDENPNWQSELQQDLNLCSSTGEPTQAYQSMAHGNAAITPEIALRVRTTVSGAICGWNPHGLMGSSYASIISQEWFPPGTASEAWSTCWDPKYEILFSDDWADAFYHANINYLDATCRNGEGLYGLDRMPCRFYETTSLFANLLYSSP